MARPVDGLVVAITGGARGLGRATAARFVELGARVAVGDVALDLAEETAAGLRGGTIALPLDVTDRPSFTAFLDDTEARLGPVDVLVNNAGIMPVGPTLEESDDTALRQLDVNLFGVILGTKLALTRMLPRGSGHVVNVASIAGRVGVAGEATYCATKHGVVGFTEAVRQELRGAGVDFSMILPNLAGTELAAGMRPARGQRLVAPEEVADAIVGAVRHRRFEVYVPRSLGPLTWAGTVLPRPLREAMTRAFGVHHVGLRFDRGARAAYDERARGAASRHATGRQGEPTVTA